MATLIAACFFITFTMLCSSRAQLMENFYSSSCPNVESIVKQAVSAKLSQTFTTVPGTLRLFFHDCFVEGCDASVMIHSEDNAAEKDAADNLSLAGDGFDTVMRAKQAVEASCPGIVSCADILAIAARDVVVLAEGDYFKVELGRRDGLISEASRVAGNLPKPEFNLKQLNDMFGKHNLSQMDMIALSGAHTVGFSHCSGFADRLDPVDPSMDPSYAQQLKAACKDPDARAVLDMDPLTPHTFDNAYYQNLMGGKGLLSSDQVLFTDSVSKQTVAELAASPGSFSAAFGVAMRKLGRVGVKTGADGEIRTDCALFNS